VLLVNAVVAVGVGCVPYIAEWLWSRLRAPSTPAFDSSPAGPAVL
jgi:hypothetical protein